MASEITYTFEVSVTKPVQHGENITVAQTQYERLLKTVLIEDAPRHYKPQVEARCIQVQTHTVGASDDTDTLDQ